MTTIKITELANIGPDLASSTVVPVVNMAGVPVTQKTNVGSIANLILEGAGVDYPEATVALLAQTVSNAAQPNITSVGTLTSLEVTNNLTASGTAYLGNISTTGVASITTLVVGTTADLGSVNNIIIEGGTDGQVLSTDGDGNLSWTTVSGGGNGVPGGSDTQVQYNDAGDFGGDADFTYDAGNNILNVIRANVSYLTAYTSIDGGNSVVANYFIGNGNLKLQPDPANANSGSYLDIFLSSGPDIHIVASQSANLILGKDNQSNVMTSWDGNVYIQSWNQDTGNVGGVWAFGGDGTTTFPTANIDLHNGGVQSGEVLQFGNPNLQSIITGPTPSSNVSAQRIIIQGQRGTGTGEGGDVYVWGGDSDVNGGDIKIYAGDAEVSGYGGYINIDGGTGINGGGGLSLTGGQSADGQGGQITIAPGYSGNSDGATLSLNGGQAAGNGGGVNITAGAGTANGGQVTITGGQSALGLSGYGNVVVSAGASQWKFDNTGNLVLPSNTFAVNYANGTQVPLGGGGGGGAAGNTGDVQINVAGNIGADSTLRYVDNGGEMTLYADYLNAPGIFTSDIYAGDGTPSNITLTTSYGNATWIFDTDGNLRTPGNVDIYGAINFPQQVSSINWSTYNIELSQYGRINTNVDFFANANTIGALYLKGDGSNISNISVSKIANGTSNVSVDSANGNITISIGGTDLWSFNGNGHFNLSDDSYLGNIESIGATGFNMGANTDFAIQTSNGSNTFTWTFGKNGELIVPDQNPGQASILSYVGNSNLASFISFVTPGSANLVLGTTGNNHVVINTDKGNANIRWMFDDIGNLTLPNGGSLYSMNSTPSGAPGNTIILQPAGANVTTNQKLMVYPTANDGDHIHMTSGNLYQTELFLGSDNFYVKLANTGNVIINSNDGNSSNAMWTFSNDGTTTFPTGNITSNTSLQFTTTFGNYRTVEYQTAGVWDLYVEDVATGPNDAWSWINVTFKDNQISKPQVFIENQKASDGIALRWTFDENGNLNFPRDVAGNTDPILTVSGGATPTIRSDVFDLTGTANLAISAFNLNVSGDAFTLTLDPDNGALAAQGSLELVANAGPSQAIWVFNPNGSIEYPDQTTFGEIIGPNTIGFAAAYDKDFTISTLSNVQQYHWEFDTTGNLTVPGNLVIAGNTSVFGTDASLLQPAGNLPLLSVSSGSNGGVSSIWVEDIGNVGTSNIAAVYANPTSGSGIVRIAVGQNGGNTGPNLWDFNANGTTTFPGDLIGNGASPAPSISGFDSANFAGNVTGAYILGNGSQLTSLPAPAVAQDITSNGAMSIMTYDGNLKYVNYATVEPSTGNIAGGNISTTGAVTANIANITTGNITTINSGLLQNGNSNITITSNGNVSIQAAGSTVELVVTSTGANITGTANITGNANVANIGANNGVFTGNISGNTNGFAIGYLNIPQVSAANATLALTDAGKHYYSTTAGNLTLTIPLNSSVAFATGTAVSIVVQAAGNILVNAASGVTLYMAGNSTAANRVVGGYGMATLMKVASDTWFINGAGVA